MPFALSTPVTGAAQTGFTSPTYTVVADVSPTIDSKQWAVTALGGTQTGVTAHSVASPFTVSVFRPTQFKVLGKTNPVTGTLPSVPMNSYKIITRKGALPLAGQPFSNIMIKTEISIPAGSDVADPAQIRAALSLHFGAVSQQSSGMGDTAINGLL